MATPLGAAPRRRVIIVDDDPIYLQVWEKILRGIEHCTYCLTNDVESVAALLTRPVDLVISDIVMSETSGYDIAKLVQEKQPQAEIVLTTGYDCNLEKFNLGNPRFHILYKPYHKIADIQRLIGHLINKENPFQEVSEDSFSENEHAPTVTEWRL